MTSAFGELVKYCLLFPSVLIDPHALSATREVQQSKDVTLVPQGGHHLTCLKVLSPLSIWQILNLTVMGSILEPPRNPEG